MCNSSWMHYRQTFVWSIIGLRERKMIKTVVFLALAVCQTLASGVGVVPAAPLVAAGVVAARSSQYFAQNHNALSAPLVAPVQPVAPIAPVVQYLAPSAASVSQVTRYAQYVTPAVASYVAAAPALYAVAPAPLAAAPAPLALAPAPLAAAPASFAVAPAPLVAKAAPLVSRPVVAPLVANAPPAAAVPAVPQQTPVNPGFQAPNPDSESVEIEAARLRSLPQARSQLAPRGPAPEAPRFQNALGQQNLAGYREPVGPQSQPQNQAIPQGLARNQAQGQQRSAAPGPLSAQQYIPSPYLG